MLYKSKERLLESINMNEIEEYLKNIVSFDRLSGSKEEYMALEYILNELLKENIDAQLKFYPVILSNPIDASLSYKYKDDIYDVASKTRSFSKSIYPRYISGELIYIAKDNFITNIMEWELNKENYKKDLLGKIVISESLNPVTILEIQSRGAIGYVQYWEGNEELIHEGIFNPIWGMPLYNELEYYPKIPIIAINGPDGRKIIDKIKEETIIVKLSTRLEEKIENLPMLEAVIEPVTSSKEFILVGNHIDSWHNGATDNGTGNALALYLAKLFNSIKEELDIGIRIVWWTGHSNGRYAGSSIYARENYLDLLANCWSYINIDMPGLKGADDYSKVCSGPELFDLAKKSIFEVTNQKGCYVKPVRGWDQSFQNIGITSYFVWASTLEDNHVDSTNNSFMSWWWHTEEDTIEYYSREVLYNDAKVYISAIMNLITNGNRCFQINKLIDKIIKRIEYLVENYNSILNLNECLSYFNRVSSIIRLQDKNNMISPQKFAFIIKKINQVYYSVRESYLQDWSMENDEIPGLSLIQNIKRFENDKIKETVLMHQLICEKNRFLELCYELELLLTS